MDAVANPYSPGAGRKPAALVGRDVQQAAWNIALRRTEAGRSAQPFVLYGLRGVGKTVLLTTFRRSAEERGWIVAQVEAGVETDFRTSLGEALHAPLADMARPGAGKRILTALRTALSFRASYDEAGTWSFGLDLQQAGGGGADTGVIETDLRKLIRDLAAAAGESGGGLAILIDEAQDLSAEERIALCAIAHAAAQDDWPVLIAFAGLPSLPRSLAEAKSYAERFQYEHVRELPTEIAVDALRIPAASEDATWVEDAVRHVVAESGGYPYYLQEFGSRTWLAADGPRIELSDARVGVAEGRAGLDAGFFRVRWDRATRAEQAYLRAMAIDGDAGSSSGEVAVRLHRAAASLGPARANLIAKGLIYAPEHGVVAFTVPGMSAFIERQPER